MDQLFFDEWGNLPRAMCAARVTEDELRAAVRPVGLAAMGDVEAVVLETDGSFSVIRRDGAEMATSMTDLRIPNRDASAHH